MALFLAVDWWCALVVSRCRVPVICSGSTLGLVSCAFVCIVGVLYCVYGCTGDVHSSVTKAVRKGGRDAGSEKGGRGEGVRRMISLYLGRWKIAPVGGVVV